MKLVSSCLAALLVLLTEGPTDRTNLRALALATAADATANYRRAATGGSWKLFDYDQKAPIDTKQVGVDDKDGTKVYDITYASRNGSRVSAYLVVPSSKGPFAGVLFLHWGLGDRKEFLPEALLYAKAGAVSLLPDEGEVLVVPDNSPTVDVSKAMNWRPACVQLIIDLMRGVDLLCSRPDVDAKRIAFVGHSFGATWGGTLSGVDKRVRAYVLMAGYPRVSRDEPNLRGWLPNERDRVAALGPFDAVRGVSHAAPSSLMFQFARHDKYITVQMATEYYEAGSKPKEEKWYETDHAFDVAAFRDRAEWLGRQIGIAAVDAGSWKSLVAP
jgi:dienelactone hydrolase